MTLEAASRSGVTIDGDAAYVGDQAGNVYAIALRDGRIRWTSDLGEPDAGRGCQRFGGAAVDVPLAVADDQVIVVGRNVDEAAVAVTAYAQSDGECRWREIPQIGSATTSTAAVGGGIVVLGFADRLVRGLDGANGQQLWSALVLSLFSPVGSPALQPDAVYLADLGGGLYRVDPQDGGRDWSFQFNEVVLRSSPVVSGDTVLLGLNDGRLVAVDADSGHLVWQSEASPGLLGTIAVSPDAVVAVKGGGDAGLIAFEHDPNGRLVNVPSPTELDPGTTLARIAAAAAVVLAAAIVPGILARRRFGDAVAPEQAEDDLDGDADDADGEEREL